ncbi:DUF5979 domain-containing protein [Leucobacter chromiireducens]|uniref:DUF5979 domain-containing protein n=1 Tax=Leucobacter chromiireducens TaxID=283877 RepID=UPI0031E433A4
MRKKSVRSGVNRGRGTLAALLVGALIAGLGALGAPAAVAAPPVTFALSTVDLASGAPVTEVNAGDDFTYVASVGCPDPDGCGPVALTVTFPAPVNFVEGGFNAPTGSRVESVVPGPNGSTVLTLVWDKLGSTAIAFLPAQIDTMVDAGLDGTRLTATGTLIPGGVAEDAITSDVTVTLRAYERAGLENASASWNRSAVTEETTGNDARAIATFSGTAEANAPSTLRFRVPGTQPPAGTSLPVSEAFDLAALSLSANPGGAKVVFTHADGSTSETTIPQGELVVPVAANVVGYDVALRGVPGRDMADAGGRTVSLTAEYTLRSTDRSGNRIVLEGTNSRAIHLAADVTDSVDRPAAGGVPSVTKELAAAITVEAVLPSIQHDVSWKTDSGESTSVYGSAEPSTLTVESWNSGIPGLKNLSISLPALNSRYFDYQELTSAPRLRFPAGATAATIQYLYGNDKTPGAVQNVTGSAGAWTPAPGPETDAPVPDDELPALAQVSGIIVVFTAADGSVISGACEETASCAGGIELSSTLRTHLRNTGAEIVPPASGSGETTVGAIANIVAETATGAKISETTIQATLRLVKPQITVKLGKRFGNEDGSDQTVYPLTGIAHAGDLYDPERDPQDFADHKLRFVASTSAKEDASEATGARELRIQDPQQEPKLSGLKSSPFNTIRVTSFSDDPAVCTTGKAPDEKPVASETSHNVWVVDRANDPTKVTKVAYEESIDPELIVGIETVITPEGAATFPTNVRCASADGSTVKFRDTQMVGGAKVSPDTIGAPETPGLLAVGNVARVTTGKNGDFADGADSLFLVDLLRAAMYKHYTADAARSGIAGQQPKTAFVLSGVPGSADTVRTVLTDRGGAKEALDVFALTGVRGARLGPDQQLTFRFVDVSGAAIGPVGTVAPSTELTLEGGATRTLTADEISDSQSEGYLAFQRIEREIDWDRDWATGEMARVGGVEIAVTRADTDEPLQRFGAFSATLDMSLRDTFLSDPSERVTGSNSGTTYRNTASILSKDAAGTTTHTTSSSVPFGVFEATELFTDVAVSWRGLNQAGKPVDGYLVAQNETPSRITLDAQNRTALGVEKVDAWNQWEQPGSIGVGLDQLSASVGGARPAPAPGVDECVAERDRNPFAINDFAGVSDFDWPTENAAKIKPGEKGPRIDGRIVYTDANGATESVVAPVDTPFEDLNPSELEWADIVSVSVEWAEAGKFIGVHRTSGGTSGSISFDLTLRDTLRTGFNYQFDAGVPQCLSGATESNTVQIDGAVQVEGATVDQMAQIAPTVSGRFEALTARQATAAELGKQPAWRFAEIMVDVEKSAVEIGVTAPSTAIYRDTAQATSPQKRWTATIRNTGNLDVSALRLATDSALLGGTWPDGDPAGFEIAPGSAFDAFDAVGANLSFPMGALSAEVWVRDEAGVWGAASLGAQNRIVLPQSGAGPHAWNEVTGFRVQFVGADGLNQRIIRGAQGALNIDTVLRTHLRSDPQELAPATQLPENAQSWQSGLTAAGVSFIGSFDAPRSKVDNANANATIQPGVPQPLVKKYTSYDADRNTGVTTTTANPGSWVNFTVVLENRAAATSNLYGVSGTDVLPDTLAYNAVNDGAKWAAQIYRLGASPEDVTDDLKFVVETVNDEQQIRWTAPEDWVLRPGERIVIQVPLQMGDGVAAGASVRNVARIVGAGIAGAAVPSACAAPDASARECVSEAFATTLRNDSVRAESYIDATHGGWDTIDRKGCDASTISDWSDGTWVRNPCVAKTTVGSTLTYRLKLINSGNMDLSELRFVDKIPGIGDTGTVLDSARGSAWQPSYVPGSARLLTGDTATELGARGDAAISGGEFRYSANADPCVLKPDAYSGPDTLGCENGSSSVWSNTGDARSRALGADIAFTGDKLRGGEYVIVEFQVNVPEERDEALEGTPLMAWNTVAVSARPSAVSHWLPAAESPRSGARWEDTALTVTLALEDGPATSWHITDKEYTATVSCTVPGRDPATALVRDVTFPGENIAPITLSSMPVGGNCVVTDMRYEPQPATAPGQYGSAFSTPAPTGYSTVVAPADGVELVLDAADNTLAITNSFAEAEVELGVDVTGNAASLLPDAATFDVALSCSFGGETRSMGTVSLRATERTVVGGIPVGANCTATETEHRGATQVSAEVDGEAVELSADRAADVPTVRAGITPVHFMNEFVAGGALTILKTVEAPSASTVSGDVAFGIECTLGGHAISLGEQSTLGLSFAPGAHQTSGSVTGIPSGAECTVRETESGGAHVAAPDRTVTILPNEEVIVEMINVFEPGTLELEKRVTGAGAGESRVPATFDIRASCTRELTIGGEQKTVTDHDALTSVAPGTPAQITELPAGSRCAVTEPDPAGAKRTTVDLATSALSDEDPADDAVLVALRGPDGDGTALPTTVRVTNEYAQTGGGLVVTGAGSGLLGGAAVLLLLGAGALILRRRKRTVG